MSASIEWGSATGVYPYVLGHSETAPDHQSIADDEDNTDVVGVVFPDAGGNGYILTGTPLELVQALAKAMSAVLEHMKADLDKSEDA